MWVLRFRFGSKRVTVPAGGKRLLVGRDEGNDVVLKAPGVSRRHCEFFVDGGEGRELWVRDLGSRLGVHRGEEALKESPVSEGDCLSLGPVWVFVQKEPTSDWVAPGGVRPEFPFLLDGGESGDDTKTPREESIPAAPFHACLEAFLLGPEWGRRWIDILGIEDFEVTYESSEGILCYWPGRWKSPPEEARRISQESGKSRWDLVWSGGRSGTRALLSALLQVLEAVHTQPARRKPPPLEPLTPPPRYVSLDRLWEQVENFAGTDIPILITGETGAGKEVLARAIHEAATGVDAPFEVIHCAAIPESLFESELFGIKDKTASGVEGRKGKLESAQGGTILLDEVGEIPLPVQVKLLRVLQDSTLVPVGGRVSIPLNVRWVSATNRDLKRAVKEGRFREDLYYRLCGAEVAIPPLRERMDTLPELVEHFFHQLEEENGRGIRGLSIEAYRCLMAHSWPGNVRELQAEVKRTYFRANPGGLIRSVHLSPDVKCDGNQVNDIGGTALDHRRKSTEESAIRQALSAEHGNMTRAAKILGITRQTLAKRMKELGIEAGEFKRK